MQMSNSSICRYCKLFCTTCCSRAELSIKNSQPVVGSKNQPVSFLVQLELVFKTLLFTFQHHETKMTSHNWSTLPCHCMALNRIFSVAALDYHWVSSAGCNRGTERLEELLEETQKGIELDVIGNVFINKSLHKRFMLGTFSSHWNSPVVTPYILFFVFQLLKEKFHKSQHFDYSSGVTLLAGIEKPGIGGELLLGQRIKPKSSVYPKVATGGLPSWVAFDILLNRLTKGVSETFQDSCHKIYISYPNDIFLFQNNNPEV